MAMPGYNQFRDRTTGSTFYADPGGLVYNSQGYFVGFNDNGAVRWSSNSPPGGQPAVLGFNPGGSQQPAPATTYAPPVTAPRPPAAATYVPPAPLPVTYSGTGPTPAGLNATLPEQNALGLMTTIDPGSEAARQNLSTSYAPQLAEAEKFAANPGQLDPETTREVLQAANAEEAARDNVQGAGEAAVNAMQVGQASLNLRDRQQAYLNNVKGLATSYLTSGATPTQAATSYLNNAQDVASAVSGGGPVYAPTSQPAPYTYINPNAGTLFSQGTQGFLSQGTGATLGNPNNSGAQLATAGAGALSGALSGAAVGGPYAPLTALIGAAAGGLGGYFGSSCWVAREIYGEDNPKWKQFREWLLKRAPRWFRLLYLLYGQQFAKFIHNKPRIKNLIRRWMDDVIDKDDQRQKCYKPCRWG